VRSIAEFPAKNCGLLVGSFAIAGLVYALYQGRIYLFGQEFRRNTALFWYWVVSWSLIATAALSIHFLNLLGQRDGFFR
jgi:hypothetical protein